MFADCRHIICSLNIRSPVPFLKLSDTSFQMPRSHLRQVHEQFHSNALEVITMWSTAVVHIYFEIASLIRGLVFPILYISE